MSRSAIRAATCMALAICVIGHAEAQTYPSRTVTLVVPFPAGGPTDTIGRVIAEGLQASLGQPVIIENAAGATGSIGTGRVARAEPDGYTLILGTVATHVFNAAAYSLKYDVAKDFDPVSLIAFDPQIIVVRKDFPATDITQLIAWLKANPDKATAGTAGVGSTSHISAVRFQKVTGTQFGFVPYRGLGPAMNNLVSGHIDILFDLAANAVPQVHAASIRGLAVTSKSRLPSAPELPTVDEAGLAGFLLSQLARDLGAAGHATRGDGQTQCCGSQDLGGSIDLESARRHRSADTAARATDGRSPCKLSERRDR